VVAKELTKLHEQFLIGSADELLARFEQDSALERGEFVVLIDNPVDSETRSGQVDDDKLLRILLDEVPVAAAARIAARITGRKKNELYRQALRLRDESEHGQRD